MRPQQVGSVVGLCMMDLLASCARQHASIKFLGLEQHQVAPVAFGVQAFQLWPTFELSPSCSQLEASLASDSRLHGTALHHRRRRRRLGSEFAGAGCC